MEPAVPANAAAAGTDYDMAFVLDCTGSMSQQIQAAQNSITTIMSGLCQECATPPRFALVGYRDHPPQEQSWVIQVTPFTDDPPAALRALNSLSANGGGDSPESLADGVHALLDLEWRPAATRVAVIITDAPPHGCASPGDGFAAGCPCGHDLIGDVHELASRGILLHVVGCEQHMDVFTRVLYRGLAFATGGRYAPLRNAASLGTLVLASAREELRLDALREHADDVCMAAWEELKRTRRFVDASMVYDLALQRLHAERVTCVAIAFVGMAHGADGFFQKVIAANRNMPQLLEECTRIRALHYGPVPPLSGPDDRFEALEDQLLSYDQLTRIMNRNAAKSRFFAAYRPQ